MGVPPLLHPHHLGSPSLFLHALCSLLAVGPPLLTLVNFEVENLAYMLVCMQWTVSGFCSGPQACNFLGEGFRGQLYPSLSVNEYMCVH